jgi:niacin transporter
MTNNVLTLPYNTPKAFLCEAGLLGAAALLPAFCHLLGAPGSVFLPMHWPVLLAGLAYGWRAGLAVGAGAVISSFVLSGMPPSGLLPFMLPEVALYGFTAGFCREILKQNCFVSLLAALVLGKLVYALLAFAALGKLSFMFVLPGAGAVAAQLALLPAAAEKWIKTLR